MRKTVMARIFLGHFIDIVKGVVRGAGAKITFRTFGSGVVVARFAFGDRVLDRCLPPPVVLRSCRDIDAYARVWTVENLKELDIGRGRFSASFLGAIP